LATMEHVGAGRTCTLYNPFVALNMGSCALGGSSNLLDMPDAG
jgi:hypothetical protein